MLGSCKGEGLSAWLNDFHRGKRDIGYLDGGDTAVLVYLGEDGAFDAVFGIAEFPELDVVGDLEGFEEDGCFERVWARAVGVEGEGFDVGGHLGGCVVCGLVNVWLESEEVKHRWSEVEMSSICYDVRVVSHLEINLRSSQNSLSENIQSDGYDFEA